MIKLGLSGYGVVYTACGRKYFYSDLGVRRF